MRHKCTHLDGTRIHDSPLLGDEFREISVYVKAHIDIMVPSKNFPSSTLGI